MSHDTTPISATRFAAALKDLPLSTLHLKAAELRNSIAHLDYSNEQLRPFADGTEEAARGVPDQDCADAIRENEVVIARMQERIQLLKSEVERRGASWTEFQSKGDVEKMVNGEGEMVNGTPAGREEGDTNMEEQQDSGRIAGGDINRILDRTGGRLDDDVLRRAMEERMRALTENADEDEDGMHL